MMLSGNSKFLFRRWLTSMLTSVLFWKIAAMLVQSSTTFRRGGLRCVFVDTVHSSRLCLKDGTIVSFFVSSLTDDIFVLKYSAYIQTSRSSPPLQWPPVLVGNHKEKSWLNQHKYWQSNLCEASCKIELQQAVSISDSMLMNITKMIGLRRLNLEKSKITDIGVQSMSGRRIVIHARWERMAWRN